jgi:myo-inositol-1(or 4)-monophosphatase
MDYQPYLDFALNAVYEASQLTLGYFQRSIDVIPKGDGSPVTVADREAESHIRKLIEAKFPEHGILGEEHGEKEAQAGCSIQWIIDPIDGTKSFIHGVPLYTTLLGMVVEGESRVGVIGVPGQSDFLAAADGLGCKLNGRSVQVSQVGDLEKAVVLTTDFPHLGEKHDKSKWHPLVEGSKFSRTWGDAYGHFLVATGRAEIMLDAELAPHDCSPLPVIMREAGGAFFDWSGEETIWGGHGISTNAALKDLVLKQIA